MELQNGQYVFISYSSKDKQVAEAVRNLLIDKRIQCWMAPYDIPAGYKYAQVINDALEKCACLLLLLTNSSQHSGFVAREVERAVSYKKPIIPMQLEDCVLESEFKFYIGNSQIIPVTSIRDDTPEINKILKSIVDFTGNSDGYINSKAEVAGNDKQKEKFNNDFFQGKSKASDEKKKIEITIWSPVEVDVFLNDKNHYVMKVDPNSGFDYAFNSAVVASTFQLIFVARGFEKTITFDRPDGVHASLDFRLKTILSKKEIWACYDRESALQQLRDEPTGYAFEQLSVVGKSEDCVLLSKLLLSWRKRVNADSRDLNYLMALCAEALGEISIRTGEVSSAVELIENVYADYPAKKSYGHIFKAILNKLSTY